MKPLAGIRIVEFAGLIPAPFAAMMLADHGAEIIRIERKGEPPLIPAETDILRRNRAEILSLDLKDDADLAHVRSLLREADGLIEGFRPGVMERLGLGPNQLCADNPRLVYGRLTGWGQEGPLAMSVGHDINFIALAGALHGYGRADGKPTPPANAVADMGGGGMLLAFGMLAGILNARGSGQGCVIDAAMVDGVALINAPLYSMMAGGMWQDKRGANLLDGGTPFYDTYETSDGTFVAFGALEPHFYAEFCMKTGFDVPQNAPDLGARLTALFMTRTRDEWCALLEGSDACFAPVLTLQEAPSHPHNHARGTFVEGTGTVQPSPAPRFAAAQSPERDLR